MKSEAIPEPDPAWFEVCEHTADMGLRITAADQQSLFLRAAAALLHFIAVAPGTPASKYEFDLHAPDQGILLADWLNEVLYLARGERVVPVSVAGLAVSDTRASGVISTCKVVIRGHGQEIKAVTYHQARVDRTPDGLVAEVIFDI